MEIRDKVVVVTGGGSGIGESLVRAFQGAGASHVVVADLDGESAARVASDVNGTAVELDVSDEDALNQMVADTLDVHGPIGLFASNAGFLTKAGIEESNERIQKMFEVHVLAHIYAARATLPSMVANGGGYFLNTASAAGLLSQIGSMSYSLTKAASISFSEWLSISHHHQGIRVSTLCPQSVKTGIAANSPDPDAFPNGLGSGVAGNDGILDPADVATMCIEAINEERFHILPHAEVQTYMERKATDVDRWLKGMRRFQDVIAGDGPKPGDAFLNL